jgi:hypothetical protein
MYRDRAVVRPEHVGAPSWTGGQEEAIQVKAVADCE